MIRKIGSFPYDISKFEKEAEKLFHDLFRYKRVNGEWFKIDNIHKIIGCL